jgi:signal transduction histidine kinase
MSKILVIEDNDNLREELVMMLSLEGFEVMSAENGRVGFECAQHSPPDLILCDLMMPEMDGYATLEALRATPACATIPFICLTARTERVDVRKAMELGADDYLTKPFTASELITAVNAGVAKKARATRESEEKLADLRQRISSSLPHELKTPLTTILGYGELLSDRPDRSEPAEIAAMARHIVAAALRLNGLTTNFLLYAELELLRNDPKTLAALQVSENVRLGDVVAPVARRKAVEADREGDLCVEVGSVAGAVGEVHLRKAVEELVDNAIKFSQPGTPIRVRTIQTGGYAVVQVSDAGRGMVQEQITAVGAYVQFERLVHEQQGLGLGLTIVKRLADLYGGGLQIESLPKHGTTVSLSFPLARGVIPSEPGRQAHTGGTEQTPAA